MKNIHAVSLGNALIWAAAILATAIVLRWSGNENMVIVILGGAAGASIMIVSKALRKS
jgi:hypothetical protein